MMLTSRSKAKPLLYFVTPEIGEDIDHWIETVKKAVEGGVELVQLRDKQSSAEKFFAAAREIQPILKERKIPFLINDRVEIALALKADGIHLGQSDMPVAAARRLLGEKAIIGLSVGNMEEAKAAEKEPVDYLAASPLFATKTKQDCSEPWGLEGLAELCASTSHPIYAIGGITLENVESVVGCGAAAVAIVSAIASASCPEEAARAFLGKVKGGCARV